MSKSRDAMWRSIAASFGGARAWQQREVVTKVVFERIQGRRERDAGEREGGQVLGVGCKVISGARC